VLSLHLNKCSARDGDSSPAEDADHLLQNRFKSCSQILQERKTGKVANEERETKRIKKKLTGHKV